MQTKRSGAAVRNLTRLGCEEVVQYHQLGYLVVPNVFSLEEMNALAEDAERVASERTDLIDSLNMRTRFARNAITGAELFDVFDPMADLSPLASAVAHDHRLFDIAHDIYGEPAELFKDKLIYKRPGAGGATLHQDWIAWPGFPKSFVTALVAIDSFTVETGATEVYPGVHRQGYLSAADGQFHQLAHESLGVEPIPLLLAPGDVAIFSGFTPHRSSANTGRTSRRGYFLSYNARSEGGERYARHYREFHTWIRSKVSAEAAPQLFFR